MRLTLQLCNVSYGIIPRLSVLLKMRRQTSGNVQMTDIWVPELHIVNNTWYVYFAADTSPKGNPTHRMYVLKGPTSAVDPMAPTSTFNLVGQVANLPDQWQIDGTVFTLNNKLYLVYSGWPLNESDGLTQELFIAKMIVPVNADPSTKAVMISTPTYPCEKYQDPGPNGAVHAINEGPAWLQLDSFQGIVFSAGASWHIAISRRRSNSNLLLAEISSATIVQ
jgi:GH43 family beta-xylosidase